MWKKIKITTNKKLISEWHSTKNTNLEPSKISIGSHKKVWWKCPVAEDHEWEASPKNRTTISERNRGGCPCCAGTKIVLSNCLAVLQPVLAAEWHPIKNGSLTPYEVLAGGHKKVWWKCCFGHEWQAKIKSRVYRHDGCPICNQSKGEKAVAEVLSNLGCCFQRQFKFNSCKNKRSLPFDFMVMTENGMKVIEFQGKQHYEPCGFGSENNFDNLFNVQKRDGIKKAWCDTNNIPLLVIPYWKYDEITTLIERFVSDTR